MVVRRRVATEQRSHWVDWWQPGRLALMRPTILTFAGLQLLTTTISGFRPIISQKNTYGCVRRVRRSDCTSRCGIRSLFTPAGLIGHLLTPRKFWVTGHGSSSGMGRREEGRED